MILRVKVYTYKSLFLFVVKVSKIFQHPLHLPALLKSTTDALATAPVLTFATINESRHREAC